MLHHLPNPAQTERIYELFRLKNIEKTPNLTDLGPETPIFNFRKQRVYFPAAPLFLTYVLNHFQKIRYLSASIVLVSERKLDEKTFSSVEFLNRLKLFRRLKLHLIKTRERCFPPKPGSETQIHLVDELRDLSISLEISNPHRAFHLIKLAKEIRPTDPVVAKHYNEQKVKLERK